MDSRARAGPHGAPCWRLMVGAYARDARAYFAAPWASWTRALRSALPRPLDRPLRPQTGETAPAQSPCCCCQQGVEGASTTRWKARKARGWAGLVLLCTFGSAHSLAMALSSLASCFVHPLTQQQRPPPPTSTPHPPKPRGGRPSSGASGASRPGAWRGIGAGGPRGNVRGAGCVAESQTQLFCDILYPNLQTFGPDEYRITEFTPIVYRIRKAWPKSFDWES